MFRTKSDADSIRGIAEALYEKYGASAVLGYFNDNHKTNEWSYCEQCMANVPILECKKYRVCAVCGTSHTKTNKS